MNPRKDMQQLKELEEHMRSTCLATMRYVVSQER